MRAVVLKRPGHWKGSRRGRTVPAGQCCTGLWMTQLVLVVLADERIQLFDQAGCSRRAWARADGQGTRQLGNVGPKVGGMASGRAVNRCWDPDRPVVDGTRPIAGGSAHHAHRYGASVRPLFPTEQRRRRFQCSCLDGCGSGPGMVRGAICLARLLSKILSCPAHRARNRKAPGVRVGEHFNERVVPHFAGEVP